MVVWGQGKRRQQPVDNWDLIKLASGPTKLLLCRGFFLYPLVPEHERPRLPEVSCPALTTVAGGWIHNVRGSLISHSLSQMWALVSASSPCCTFDMINSVSNQVPDTHSVISETASQPAQRPLFKLFYSVQSASSSPRAPPRNIASEEATAGEQHTFPHHHSSVLSCLFEHLQEYIWLK